MHACFRQQSALEITQLFRAFGVKMCFLPKSLCRAVVYVRASMRARINTIDLFYCHIDVTRVSPYTKIHAGMCLAVRVGHCTSARDAMRLMVYVQYALCICTLTQYCLAVSGNDKKLHSKHITLQLVIFIVFKVSHARII